MIFSRSLGPASSSVDEVWTLTANVKMYLPFDWRIQPFAKVGLGVQHSKVDVDIETASLFASNTANTVVVPADFEIHDRDSGYDGVVRVGGGADFYATENWVFEGNVNYVVPFANVGSINADYVAIQWRIVYRF